MNDVNAIVKQHEAGFAGLRHLYPKDLLWNGVFWPAVISTVLTGFFLSAKLDPQRIVTSIVDAVVSVMPSLLGFLLGGYTILISFSNSKLLKSLTTIPEGSQISVFQKVSCVFALTILVQSATLFLALAARFSMLVIIPIPTGSEWLLTLFQTVDYVFSFLLMLMLLYTIVAFKDIITNIFSLTQLFHVTVVMTPDNDELEPLEAEVASSKPRRNGGAY